MRSATRLQRLKDGKTIIGSKGSPYRRVLPFSEQEFELMAPGEPRKILKVKTTLHVTKGFRIEREIRLA